MKEPKDPGPGARMLNCQIKVGSSICGDLHHEKLHGSEGRYGMASKVRGASASARKGGSSPGPEAAARSGTWRQLQAQEASQGR